MVWSIVLDGKVLDFKFEKCVSQPNIYRFKIGGIYVGRIHKIRNKWSAVSAVPNTVCPVHGFCTRLDAAQFLISFNALESESGRMPISTQIDTET